MNTEDVFKRAKKSVQDLQEEVQTLKIQREEVSEYSGQIPFHGFVPYIF